MSKNHRRQSLIINNFFTLASIIIIAVTLTLYNRYFNQVNETNLTNKQTLKKEFLKLNCQKNNDRFKVVNHSLMKNSLKALNQGYYKLSGGFLQKEENSVIMDIVNKEKIDSFYKSAIKAEQKDDISKFLQIDYEIIEGNITQTKGFKSGSVKTLFKVNGNEIFRYYSDFKFYDENEIKDIINCTIKVYKDYASK